jgi:hypothetical protein
MSKAGEGVEEIPPPPKGDASGGKTTPVDGTLKDSHVEKLSSELKQLKLQRKIDKLKDSKSWELASSSSSNEEINASSEEEAKGKRGRKGDKKYYNTTSFNYDNLPPSSAFTSVPIGKAPRFDGTDYTKWRYSMKMHLISLNLSVWTIVRTWVEFLDEDEEQDFEQLQQIHRNTQTSLVFLSSLEKDEFDRVNGLEKVKDIWDTLQRSHEGTKSVKKAKRQLIEGQLDRFVMLDDEDPQVMYNRLKKLVNKVRAYGSRRWDGRRVIDRMLRADVVKDTTVISLIQQDPTFKKMTLNDVLWQNHQPWDACWRSPICQEFNQGDHFFKKTRHCLQS